MILPLIAACVMAQEEHSLDPGLILSDAAHHQTSELQQIADPLRTPEMSPKKFGDPAVHWEFRWETVAWEKMTPGDKLARFYIFSQDRKPENDIAMSVGRMLERLWEYGYADLKTDLHSPIFGKGVVEVFLCNGGVPGGEQLFDEDKANGGFSAPKVNTIYFYDLPTFTDPIEMAREVAHEYGHATLAGVNGYTEPEDWANGYLGERLYLKHMSEAMSKHELEPADAMGCSLVEINKWLDAKVKPLLQHASQLGPDLASLKARDAAGMNRYIGLALYVDTLLPETVFRRSQDIMPSTNAEDYPECAAVAASEPDRYTLNIPPYLSGKSIWIPFGKGQLTGAKVSKRLNGWSYIVPTGGPITVVPSHEDIQ